jgi:hypothetical protein
MKIQKRGSWLGPARMPQKAYSMIDSSVAKAPAISSFGDPAMRRCASELAKRNVAMMSSRVWKARMCTASVHSALR